MGIASDPDWFPDPVDENLMRYWDGEQWTSHTHLKPFPSVVRGDSERVYTMFAWVMGVLAVVCVVMIFFLLFVEVRSGGAQCGTLVSPKLAELVDDSRFWECHAVLVHREMWTLFFFWACVVFLVIGAIDVGTGVGSRAGRHRR